MIGQHLFILAPPTTELELTDSGWKVFSNSKTSLPQEEVIAYIKRLKPKQFNDKFQHYSLDLCEAEDTAYFPLCDMYVEDNSISVRIYVFRIKTNKRAFHYAVKTIHSVVELFKLRIFDCLSGEFVNARNLEVALKKSKYYT